MSSEGSVYENWEDSCLVKFSEFLGFPTVRFEKEILGLMRKMVAMQQKDKKKGVAKATRCERELKKLASSINYNGRDKFKVEGKDKGNLSLKLK